MLPFQVYNYGFHSCSSRFNHNGSTPHPRYDHHVDHHHLDNTASGGDYSTSTMWKIGKNSAEAGKSHKEAERRRRQRINAHLSTLRSLLPNSAAKADKASLLAAVVSSVKELRNQAAEIAVQYGDLCCGGQKSTGLQAEYDRFCFPSEVDETSLGYCDGEGKVMKAVVCCDDRPGLNRDLAQAIRSFGTKPIQAEMMTIGGRTKNLMVLKWAGESGDDEQVGALKRALKAVVEKRTVDTGPDHSLSSGNKRARIINCPYGQDNSSSIRS